MPFNIKKILNDKVKDHLIQSGLNYAEKSLLSVIQLGSYKNNSVEFQIPLKEFTDYTKCTNFPKTDLFYDVNIIKDAKLPCISFKTNPKPLVKNTINLESSLYHRKPKANAKTLVEFSSPNIAKPFHVGHLRSTIIGSFISNLKEYLGHDVIRLNYLGDWGTQFGFLKLGVDLKQFSNDDMERDPIKHLYEAYVYANKLAQTDPNINQKARDIFARLEQGNAKDLEQWKLFRQYTVNELVNTYKRLNVAFTKYDWESMYDSNAIQDVITLLLNKNLLKTDDDGRKYVQVHDRKVTVVKSDGSSLYLSRDIAAALDRNSTYKFDNMYYVVDNAQTDHFIALFDVLKHVDTDLYKKCQHIKYGRIKGMSTRKGEVVFLEDILDEAKDIMFKRQLEASTTKCDLDDYETADILGTTAVIINDLKQRRTRDYDFDWTNILHMQGDSGIKLQHTHCRLHNLELNSGAKLAESCIPELLMEPQAMHLIVEIARFEDVVMRADAHLEACIIVNYLFGLSNSISKALKTLKVKGEGELGDQRLLMFHCAKRILNQGMQILGLKPLERM